MGWREMEEKIRLGRIKEIEEEEKMKRIGKIDENYMKIK